MRMKASHSTCSIQTCRNKELTSSKVIPGVVTPSEVELASRQPLRESERFDNLFVLFFLLQAGSHNAEILSSGGSHCPWQAILLKLTCRVLC